MPRVNENISSPQNSNSSSGLSESNQSISSACWIRRVRSCHAKCGSSPPLRLSLRCLGKDALGNPSVVLHWELKAHNGAYPQGGRKPSVFLPLRSQSPFFFISGSHQATLLGVGGDEEQIQVMSAPFCSRPGCFLVGGRGMMGGQIHRLLREEERAQAWPGLPSCPHSY